MSNRLQATPDAQAAHDQIAEAGGLKLTVSAGTVPAAAAKGRRRTPSMPRVSLDNRPTAERASADVIHIQDVRRIVLHQRRGAEQLKRRQG